MALLYDSNFLTVASFVVFVAILWYFGVHRFLGAKLDERAERIRGELDRARALREEAQRKFAEYERKRAEVDQVAQEIVDKAKRDAEAAKDKALEDLDASIRRRLQAAEEQIAQAEEAAVRQVQARAVDVAVAAARQVMQERMTDDIAARLIDRGIEQAGSRLN